MKVFKIVVITLFVGLPCLVLGQQKLFNKKMLVTQNQLTKPKLIVGIVVDQMRYDFLFRYASRYGQGGFKRILRTGFNCANTQISYIPTVTAAGHAGIYTGSVPALHGITGNDWIEQATGKMVYCTQDSTVTTIGSSSVAGNMSPHNLWASTLADELKLATNFNAKVIGIALKDRGAILPAGHSANGAYWFDDATGNWITSSYYTKTLAPWVSEFNAAKLADKYLQTNWHTLYNIATYTQSEADSNSHEGAFKGENAPVFPHIFAKNSKGYGLLRATPYGNTITFDFAKKAINAEKMGQGNFTDLLTISLSSTDYIGHQFGPNAIETEDTYLRLDKDIASFLTFLDTKLGANNYTIFLTADHGVAHNTMFLTDHKIPAGLFDGSKTKDSLNLLLKLQFGHPNLVLSFNNYQVNFNHPLIQSKQLNIEAIKSLSINYLHNIKEVAYAIDMQKINDAAIPNSLKNKIINGYNPSRCGDIQLLLKPGYFSGYGTTGTTHGTWNPYDSHIPLLFMGWGIKQGNLHRPTAMADIAPTISALLHIQEPNACIGDPIAEVLKPEK
jgi:predicted AlkP superfamily pyrophosphatase or phosphodiesterase